MSMLRRALGRPVLALLGALATGCRGDFLLDDRTEQPAPPAPPPAATLRARRPRQRPPKNPPACTSSWARPGALPRAIT
jgi:hypothetical protein